MLGTISENRGKKGSKYVVRFKSTFKRFNNLDAAEQFLNTLRYKDGNDLYDPRDYQRDAPLGFGTLSKQWLEKKRDLRSAKDLRNHINYAVTYFANTNIKEIDYPQLEDFFSQLPQRLSAKTKHNIKSTLHAFCVWVVKRNRRAKVRVEMPEFPEIPFELGWRKTIDKATQGNVLECLKDMAWSTNPKIWIACLWLSTYVNVRPIEMIHVREDDISPDTGIMRITYNKERRPKVVYLLDEDVELVRSFPRAIGNPYFFRHGRGKGLKAGERFGPKYLNTWWMRACEKIGVEGVPLYPGTKHSSIIALGDTFSPEQIKKHGSGHATNKAFDRYYQVDAKKKRELFAVARCTTGDRHIMGLGHRPGGLIARRSSILRSAPP